MLDRPKTEFVYHKSLSNEHKKTVNHITHNIDGPDFYIKRREFSCLERSCLARPEFFTFPVIKSMGHAPRARYRMSHRYNIMLRNTPNGMK